MKYSNLYSDIDDDGQELYFSLSSVISDELILREAIKIYQQGKAQDLLYAENVLAKGGNFGMVNKVVRSNIKKRAAARPDFDQKLRKALIKSYGLPDKKYKYQAHHIVAKDSTRAKKAADVVNGVFLPKDEHARKNGVLKNAYAHENIHTKAYYANVTFQLVELFENEATQDDVKNLLRDIADNLRKGIYPIHQYLPGAEDYA